MGLILRWGLGIGVAVALIDALAVEVARTLTDEDVVAGIVVVDQLISLALYGWAGYQIGGRLRELRPGLETAVLASLIAGLVAAAYGFWRPLEAPSLTSAVTVVAENVILAAAAAAVGVWLATARRPAPPPER
jgi:hypothetical protein